MIKAINDFKCGQSWVLTYIETQKRLEELTVDRSESTFGGKPSLTLKEIAKGNKLVERSRQITAW